MKKKIVGLVLAFCVTLSMAFLLSACGGGTEKCYFTIAQLSGVECEITAPSGVTDEGDGYYVLKDEECSVYISIDEGYEIGDLKVYVNSSEIAMEIAPSSVKRTYKGTFVAKSDFDVTFTGSVKEIESTATLNYITDSIFGVEDEIFVKFGSYTSELSDSVYTLTSLKEFLGAEGKQITVKATEPLIVYIYANEYKYSLSNLITGDIGGESFMYQNGSEIGLRYEFKSLDNFTLNFQSTDIEQMAFFNQDIDFSIGNKNDLIGTTFNNGIEDKEYLTLSDFTQNKKPTITFDFKYYNDPDFADLYQDMSIKINDREVFDVTKVSDCKLTVELDKPFTYDIEGNHFENYYSYFYIKADLIDKVLDKGIYTTEIEGNKAITIFVNDAEMTPITDYNDGDDGKLYQPVKFDFYNDNQKYIRSKHSEYNTIYTYLNKTDLKYTVKFVGEVNFDTAKLGDVTVDLINNTNEDVSIIREYDSTSNLTTFTIMIKAGISFDAIYFN